jgi:hypothetical protein
VYVLLIVLVESIRGMVTLVAGLACVLDYAELSLGTEDVPEKLLLTVLAAI